MFCALLCVVVWVRLGWERGASLKGEVRERARRRFEGAAAFDRERWREFFFQFRILKNCLFGFFQRRRGLASTLLSLSRMQGCEQAAEREDEVTPATANTAHWGRKKKKKNVATTSMAADDRERRELLLRVEGPFPVAHCTSSAPGGEGGLGPAYRERILSGKKRENAERGSFDPRMPKSLSLSLSVRVRGGEEGRSEAHFFLSLAHSLSLSLSARAPTSKKKRKKPPLAKHQTDHELLSRCQGEKKRVFRHRLRKEIEEKWA